MTAMKECCLNRKHYNHITRYDYSNIKEEGVVHIDLDGFACTGFACTGLGNHVIHMVGVNPEEGLCELYGRVETGR